jgi:hypothetical protein
MRAASSSEDATGGRMPFVRIFDKGEDAESM